MTHPATVQRVAADLYERQRVGLAKYGVPVEDAGLSLKQWLQNAYEEACDQVVYLRRCLDMLEVPQDPAEERIAIAWQEPEG